MSSVIEAFAPIQSSRGLRNSRTDLARAESAATAPLLSRGLTERRVVPFRLTFQGSVQLDGLLHGSGHEASWHWRVIGELQRLAELPRGWDSYGAEPLSARAAERCITWVFGALPDELAAPSVVPMRDGGVQLEWHRGGVDFEIAIPPSGPLGYLLGTADGAVEEWEGEPSEFVEGLESVRGQLAALG